MELAVEDCSSNITESVPRPCKHNIGELMQWLQELEKKEKALRQVEDEFLRTRNEELLKPFPPETKTNLVELKEKIEDPVYLCDIPESIKNASNPKEKQFYEMMRENIIEDAKLFNPKAEIKIVDKTDGSQSMAVIGVDYEAFRSFRALRNEERKVKNEIAATTADLKTAIATTPVKEPEHNAPVLNIKTHSFGQGKGR